MFDRVILPMEQLAGLSIVHGLRPWRERNLPACGEKTDRAIEIAEVSLKATERAMHRGQSSRDAEGEEQEREEEGECGGHGASLTFGLRPRPPGSHG